MFHIQAFGKPICHVGVLSHVQLAAGYKACPSCGYSNRERAEAAFTVVRDVMASEPDADPRLVEKACPVGRCWKCEDVEVLNGEGLCGECASWNPGACEGCGEYVYGLNEDGLCAFCRE